MEVKRYIIIGRVEDPKTGELVEVTTELTREQYDKLFDGTVGPYSIRETPDLRDS